MFVRWSGFLVLIFLIVSLNFACGKKEETGNETDGQMPEIIEPQYDNYLPGKEGLKNAVKGYIQSVIDANLSDNHVKFIRKYATERETKRVFIFINSDRERKVGLKMRANKVAYGNISTSEKVNFVDTSEHWDFQYLDIASSKPVAPVRSMRYELRYHLQKEEGKWLVHELEEREESKSGEYSPPRLKM